MANEVFNVRTVIQSSGWNPFQTYLLVASLLAGVSGLFFPNESSQAITRVVPYSVLVVWYIGLIVGSIATLIGSHFKLQARIQVEIMGLSLLTFVTFGYSTLISVISGRPFSYSILLTEFFCLACIAKLAQLLGKLKKLNQGSEVQL